MQVPSITATGMANDALQVLSDSVPVVAVIFLLLLGGSSLGSALALSHLLAHERTALDKASLQVAGGEFVSAVPEAFEANDTVHTLSADEGNDAGEDLDLELGHKEGAIVDVDAQESGVEMLGGKGLSGAS